MFKEFKEFALKGNFLDMAIGIMIGAALGLVISSLVNDILMPGIGLLLGNVDFSNLYVTLKAGTTDAGPYKTLVAAKAAGAVTINYGLFINAIISFLIVAFCLFMLIRSFNRLKRRQESAPVVATTRSCPECYSSISLKATRCPCCTAKIGS